MLHFVFICAVLFKLLNHKGNHIFRMIKLSKEKLSKIRILLPQGSGRKISKILGCTECTVSRVLNGASDFTGVLEEALKIIEERKALLKKIEEM
jgi:hypothetical protein